MLRQRAFIGTYIPMVYIHFVVRSFKSVGGLKVAADRLELYLRVVYVANSKRSVRPESNGLCGSGQYLNVAYAGSV